MLIQIYGWLILILIVACFIIWSKYSEEKSAKKLLEKAIYDLELKHHVLKKYRPEHYVQTRNHSRLIMGEIVSPYDECLNYEVLLNAIAKNDLGKYVELLENKN